MKAAHPRLARTFSLLERDSWQVDQNDLSDLQKVGVSALLLPHPLLVPLPPAPAPAPAPAHSCPHQVLGNAVLSTLMVYTMCPDAMLHFRTTQLTHTHWRITESWSWGGFSVDNATLHGSDDDCHMRWCAGAGDGQDQSGSHCGGGCIPE